MVIDVNASDLNASDLPEDAEHASIPVARPSTIRAAEALQETSSARMCRLFALNGPPEGPVPHVARGPGVHAKTVLSPLKAASHTRVRTLSERISPNKFRHWTGCKASHIAAAISPWRPGCRLMA